MRAPLYRSLWRGAHQRWKRLPLRCTTLVKGPCVLCPSLLRWLSSPRVCAACDDACPSPILTSRLLSCVRVITDGLLKQTGREFKSKVPHDLVLPPSTGLFGSVTDAIVLHIVSFLGDFPRPAEPALTPYEIEEGKHVKIESDGDGSDDDDVLLTGDKLAAMRFFGESWHRAPSRHNVPAAARALACTCDYIRILLMRHAVAVAQHWR